MPRRATVTEADMRRAIKAATDCGLTVRECIMRPTEVRLIFGEVGDAAKDGEQSNVERDPRLKDWSDWPG
ncbi:hypothetical protein [Pelagibius sp. Alg239-R121]|uniref:hypothetical protein n=1 Tax=Pelagibius sp. Alg239-R121 TaxID=2993448 RepID=UPI0024A61A99|nr:hypothetical protein [Pelagibius sp. Alg239-R121]